MNRQQKLTVYPQYHSSRRIVLHRGDCIELLRSMPPDCVDLVLTSPPYALGKDYESESSLESVLDLHRKVLPEVVRVTRPGGSICWQVGYHVQNRRITPLDFLVFRLLAPLPDVVLRNRIIWTFGHGHHETARFSGRHEMILWFTKGDTYHFDLNSVRVPQKYPGKRHYKGPNKGKFSGNPRGKNPSDVWEIPHVMASHPEKTSHPCQFPLGLAQRLVRALCPPGGVVLDPFAGSGTAGAAAVLDGRRFVGAEIKRQYWNVAVSRLKQAATRDLKFRSPDQPIQDPARNGSVAMKPAHFLWNPDMCTVGGC